MKREYLEGGRILSAHGVRGAVKAEHFCDGARVLAKQKRIFFKTKDGFTEVGVLSASVAGDTVIMTLEGVSDRDAAIALKGRVLYLHRSDIPVKQGDMLIADIIGLPVFHIETGEPLGEVADVSDTAGRRIYTVKYDGREVLVPGVSEFIKEISERGVGVLPIPGLFSDDEI